MLSLPRTLVILLSILASFGQMSCTSVPHDPSKGDQELQSSLGDLQRLVILGTNDIHGALAPVSLKSREPDGGPSVDYTAGGAAILAGYVRAIQEEYGQRLLWLDSGDEFQGSIESNMEQGAPVVQVLNGLGLQAAAVGNHEFDFGLEALKARMSEALYPYLAANIFQKGTKTLASFPNTRPRTIFTLGGIRVGVIGLTTQDTPTTTRTHNVRELDFGDLKSTTLSEAASLRREGAQVIVLNAHVGLKCERGRVYPGHSFRKPTDPQGECGEKDELVRLLKSLPAGTVDAVVAGHSHQIVHHWVAGVPVIQGGASGRYLNLIHIAFDPVSGKVVREKSQIEGPIPVCERIFKNQNDCNGDRPPPRNGRGPLVESNFRGRTIEPDPSIVKLLEPVFLRSEAESKRRIAEAARPLEHERYRESAMGNVITDAFRDATGAQIAIMNSGGIRSPLEQGPITYGDVFRALPFDNALMTMKLTGDELKLLLRIIYSGSRGFPSVSGLKLRVIDPAFEAPGNDLNGNGKTEAWEVNRLIDARLASSPDDLKSKQHYTIATIDFLATGGDDWGWFMNQIPKDRILGDTGMLMRDAVVRYLEKAGTINDSRHPAISATEPRIKLEKKAKKGKKKGGRKRRGH